MSPCQVKALFLFVISIFIIPSLAAVKDTTSTQLATQTLSNSSQVPEVNDPEASSTL